MKAKQYATKQLWINEEIKKPLRKFLETSDNEKIRSKTYGCSKSSSKKEVYSNKSLPQEIRKTSNKRPNLAPKAIRERRTGKTQG